MCTKAVLCEMLYELQSNRLEVILVPQDEPANVGACTRMAVAFNCQWYRNCVMPLNRTGRENIKNLKQK